MQIAGPKPGGKLPAGGLSCFESLSTRSGRASARVFTSAEVLEAPLRNRFQEVQRGVAIVTATPERQPLGQGHLARPGRALNYDQRIR